jgi:AcrR family transcriptional regulator
MTKKTQLPWIEKGYNTFAYEGPKGLKVERLARDIGKNKSSFYHHFADLEIFTELLLEQHMQQASIMAEKEADCHTLQDLIEVLLEHKNDLLFNRQLRIHRENEDFRTCFVKTNELTYASFAPLWAKLLELEDNSQLANLVLQLSIENFYIQITDETLNREWLTAHFKEVQFMVREFKKTGKVPALDGSV